MSKKKDKAAAGGAPATPVVSVAAHPRAQASIRRIRGRVALAAFAIVLFMSLKAGVPGQEAALRALVAGIAGNLAARACAVAVWRHLVVAELRVVENARRERARARVEAAEAAAAAARASA